MQDANELKVLIGTVLNKYEDAAPSASDSAHDSSLASNNHSRSIGGDVKMKEVPAAQTKSTLLKKRAATPEQNLKERQPDDTDAPQFVCRECGDVFEHG
jgi:hypothetical protein